VICKESIVSLTPGEAADSLKEIQRTQSRSASARGYANTSPFLIMWGLIWMVGYAVSDLAPRYSNGTWALLILAGFLGSMAIGRTRAKEGNPHPGMSSKAGWRFVAMFIAIGCFISATYAIFGSATTAQQAAFNPLIVSLAYVIMGIWKGPRLAVTGIAIAALTLGGFFLLHQHFLLWMAVVGGGALLLGGRWLRKA
jgi:hypothetical protein